VGELLFPAELVPLDGHLLRLGKMDHLVCFLPGLLALGVNSTRVFGGRPQTALEHMTVARGLMRTCYELYAQSPSGLAPEIVRFGDNASAPDFVIDPNAAHSLLRPETVGELHIMRIRRAACLRRHLHRWRAC
jgi:hypothetical protein